MTKTKSKKSKSKTKRQPKPAKLKPAVSQNPDCPYRVGTLYATLFTEGNRDYIVKADLIAKVAELMGKSVKVVGFAYEVLKSKGHRSNKGRSTTIEEDGKVKLIQLKKSATE
jgi:hypothetical protein